MPQDHLFTRQSLDLLEPVQFAKNHIRLPIYISRSEAEKILHYPN